MIFFQGENYITDKEASLRYGFSKFWFSKQRWKKMGPPYIKLLGKIYYSEKVLDDWFQKQTKWINQGI